VNCSRTICSPTASGGKGNDQGEVEGLVGYARRNFMVPVPHAASFAEFNEYLLERCRRRFNDRLRGHDETIGERLARDLAVLLPLPPAPYEACEKIAVRVSSLSLVRYRGNDYSVPTEYGYREVLVRGYVHEVVIACAAEEIARHPRSYEKEDFVFNPLHYLALLEDKVGALDQAAPLAGWELPAEFATLRRLLEARMGKPGKREFVQVLRLLEVFRPDDVLAGVRAALERGVIGLRCGQASGAVPDRAASAAAGPQDLSLPAAGDRDDHLARGLPEPAGGRCVVSDTPQVLLAHHLKALKLPTFLREYDKLARQCAADGVDHPRYLLRLAELELIDRERRTVERRIKEARFPAVKSLDSFDFAALPSLNKTLVLELARCEYVARRENLIAVGNSGTGKTHVALGLGLAACQKGLAVGFTTAAALVHELIEARDEKRLLRLQRQLAGYKLLIVDELEYVPLSPTGAELLFEVFSQRYERGSTIVTSNLPFDEWTGVFGSERLTGALLDRLTHHVHILEMNGDSYRLKQSKRRPRADDQRAHITEA
jgi:DNA replication protein DnaC